MEDWALSPSCRPWRQLPLVQREIVMTALNELRRRALDLARHEVDRALRYDEGSVTAALGTGEALSAAMELLNAEG